MTLNKGKLKRALLELSRTVETRKDEITSHVFGRVEEGVLYLFTTNIKAFTEIHVSADGSLFEFDANYTELKKFIQSATGDEVVITENTTNYVTVECGGTVVDFPQFDASEFDIMAAFDTEQVDIEINVPEQVYNAIDKNNPKFELNALYVDFRGGKVVGSDTRRLAWAEIEKIDIDPILIHKDHLPKKGGRLKIVNYDDDRVEYTTGTIRTIATRVKGRFPSYERIIPEAFRAEIQYNGDEMLAALKGKNEVSLTFRAGWCDIVDLDSGAASKIQASYILDVPFAIKANAKYITQAVAGNEASIKINADNSPFQVGSTVIMPISDRPYYDDDGQIPTSCTGAFEYKQTTKKRSPRVNKDKIIKERDEEIVRLKKEIEALRADNDRLLAEVKRKKAMSSANKRDFISAIKRAAS